MDQHYKGVRSNVINVTMGWGCKISRKNKIVALEWSLTAASIPSCSPSRFQIILPIYATYIVGKRS